MDHLSLRCGRGVGEETVWGKLICIWLQNNFKLYLIVFFFSLSWLFKLDNFFFLTFCPCVGQKPLDDD